MNGLRAFLDRQLLLILVVGSGLSYSWPTSWGEHPLVITKGWIPWVFMTAMFSIGALLPADEVNQTVRQWRGVLLGTLAQYGSMPLLGFLIARGVGTFWGLPEDYKIGLIMVGSVPGAMASNLVTLLARGNVSYSVSVTTTSTLLSPIIVPIAFSLFLGRSVDLDPWGTSSRLLGQVVLPVVVGFTLARLAGWFRTVMGQIGPILAHGAILWIVMFVIGENRSRLGEVSAALLFALVALNLLGYLAGWMAGGAGRLEEGRRRALAIEVGMQNAGLGTVLALQLFPDRPAIQVPTALYTFGCIFTGTILASWWAKRPQMDGIKEETGEKNG